MSERAVREKGRWFVPGHHWVVSASALKIFRRVEGEIVQRNRFAPRMLYWGRWPQDEVARAHPEPCCNFCLFSSGAIACEATWAAGWRNWFS